MIWASHISISVFGMLVVYLLTSRLFVELSQDCKTMIFLVPFSVTSSYSISASAEHSAPSAHSTYFDHCSSGSCESNEAYCGFSENLTQKHSRDGTRELAVWEKSEVNFIQNILRLLHISHISRNAQADHMSPMKHIVSFQKI
jgi:hypothetical protein